MKNNNNEVKKGLPYAEYKANNGNTNRKFKKTNQFKSKIYSLIKQSKGEDVELNKTLKIMFNICHLEAHVPFLMQRIEEEQNYYKTLINIQKCKNRALNELLYHTNHMEVMINKKGKADKRLWKAVFKVTYKELTIICVTNYKDVEKMLGRLAAKETDLDETMTILTNEEKGTRVLDSQQYFTNSLKEMLDKTDLETQKLMQYMSRKKYE